jgi:hypothetical protein
MTFSSASRIAVLLLAGLGVPTVAQSQAGTQNILGCDVYDSCALRVRHRLLRTEIVRGTEDTPIAEIGFGPPPSRSSSPGRIRQPSVLMGFERTTNGRPG